MRVFLWGCAATIPTLLVEHLMGAGIANKSLGNAAFKSFLVIGPVEELFKLAAVWAAIYRSEHFQEPLDGIIYACTAAVGFACVENMIYIVELGAASIFSRFVFATPAHILFAAIWGYALGTARFRLTGEFKIIASGLIIAAACHGMYNFIIAVNPKLAMFILFPVLSLLGFAGYKLIKSLRGSHPIGLNGEGAVTECPVCGAYNAEETVKCPRCGINLNVRASDSPRFCSQCRTRLIPGQSCRHCSVVEQSPQENGSIAYRAQ